MFCENCGKQIPDGKKFCRFCGAQQGNEPKVNPAQNQQQYAPQYQPAPAYAPPVSAEPKPAPASKPKEKTMKTSTGIFVFICIAILAAVVIWLAFIRPILMAVEYTKEPTTSSAEITTDYSYSGNDYKTLRFSASSNDHFSSVNLSSHDSIVYNLYGSISIYDLSNPIADDIMGDIENLKTYVADNNLEEFVKIDETKKNDYYKVFYQFDNLDKLTGKDAAKLASDFLGVPLTADGRIDIDAAKESIISYGYTLDE